VSRWSSRSPSPGACPLLAAAAVSIDDPRLTPIVEACAAAGSLALVGAPVQDEDARTYIAMLAVDGSGVTVVYRKMWLGGAEPDLFSQGDRPPDAVAARCGGR
jgi:predicted amidohydrolase